jgi:FAD synthetase
VFLSFNGGKDCTVLLHLLSEFLKEDLSKLKVIYFRALDPFPEIEDFVKYCETYYKIEINSVLAASSMKDVLADICEKDKDIKACIMGSRHTDPYCEKLNSFQV